MSALMVAAAICAVGYLVVCARAPSEIRSLLKTASVMLLAVAAGLAGGGALLVAALALCALGDWMLSRDGEGAFMAGVGAFAAGHLVYVVLFITHPEANPARWSELPQLLFIFGLIVLGLGMAWLLMPRAGDLQGPVMGYIPIILAMGLAALVLPPEGALRFALPAALFFILSDMVLASEKFLLTEDHPLQSVTPYVIWSTYWLAQFGFLLALT
ncbi:MAG: lysoplasmalogenase family protein [Paracoccaceae bacterium]